MQAKIYKPTKTAMQSGKANTKKWILEFSQENTKSVDDLMGWTGNADTKQQLKLKFKTQEEAEKYAITRRIRYVVIQPNIAKTIKQTYAENFIK